MFAGQMSSLSEDELFGTHLGAHVWPNWSKKAYLQRIATSSEQHGGVSGNNSVLGKKYQCS